MNPLLKKATGLLQSRSASRAEMPAQPPARMGEKPKMGGGLLDRMRNRVRGSGPTVMKRPPGM